MVWNKRGLIFSPSGQHPWLISHATNPLALRLSNDLYRVYFASRDREQRSHIGYVEFHIKSPENILHVADGPVLAPAPLGYFDDHGVFPASIVKYDHKLFMYYVGFSPGVKQSLFYTSIGLAISEDEGKTFNRMFKTPILTRSEFDPWMVSTPFVMREQGIWRMWYMSGFKFEIVDNEPRSYYNIKYAESKDGIHWERSGLACIDQKGKQRNIARTCILKENGLYRMWYPYNFGQGYRIGYAESKDGYVWARKDEEAGIDVSPSGWDSKAVAYPWVFSEDGIKYMIYNGNQFGRDGFGLAVEVSRN